MQEKHVNVRRTARYYLSGKVTDSVRRIWLVCHGYGHLAADFIKAFEVLSDAGSLVVAPEALSRFYLQGFYGKVGASWMTREDRLHEIEDYVHYLDVVYRDVSAGLSTDEAELNVLGFSQGAATASRWVCLRKVPVRRLIIWSGHIPPDLDLAEHRDFLRGVDLYLVYGKHDKIVTGEQVAEQEERLKSHAIPYRTIVFDGGHEISQEVVAQFRKK